MSMDFTQATNKAHGLKTHLHDDDPKGLLEEVVELSEPHGLTVHDWEFTRNNYRGEPTGPFDWKNEEVSVKLGTLFP